MRWGCLLVVAILGVGCASSGGTKQGQPEAEQTTENRGPSADAASARSVAIDREDRPEAKKTLRLPEVRERIEDVAQDWLGVPYEWGGDSKQGVDCSALVQTLFHEAFDHRLPRVTELQVQAGSMVTRPQLRAGDLVFFRPENQYNHVGIYLGDQTFIHASSSDGVTKAPLDTNYWRRYYWTSRRVLGPSKVPDSLARELIAYRQPASRGWGSVAEGRGETGQAGAATEGETRDRQIASAADTTSIQSCSDPGVQCSTETQAGVQDTVLTPADTIERKGW